MLLRTNGSACLPVIWACNWITHAAPAISAIQSPGSARSASTLRISGCNRRRTSRLYSCLSMATMLAYPRASNSTTRFWPTNPAAPVTTSLAFLSIIASPASQLDALEHEFGHATDHGHDGAPKPWQVDHGAVFVDGAYDAARDAFRRRPQQALPERHGHRGVDETRLEGND